MSEQPERTTKQVIENRKANLKTFTKTQFAMFQSEIFDDFSQGPKFAEESI